jgi:hypothetical protein
VSRRGTTAHLAVTGVLSVGAPVAVALWVDARVDDAAAALGTATGEAVSIGGVDADLTGTVRLSDVTLGAMARADAIEASPSLASLLDGAPAVDELHVIAPQLVVAVDANGDSDLARVARRVAERRAGGSHAGAGAGGGASSRVRRVIVDGGSLVAHVAGVGDIRADDVELVPDGRGVRVVTGRVHVHASDGGSHGGLALASPGSAGARSNTAEPCCAVSIDLDFAHGAAELALPRGQVGRILTTAGTGTVVLPGGGEHPVLLRDVSAGRLVAGGPIEVRAALDDGGVPRPIGGELARDDAGGVVATLHGDRAPLRVLAAIAPHGVDVDGARATGTVVVRHHAGALRLELDGAIAGARFDHAAIAAQPIGVDVAVKGTVELGADAITVAPTAVTVGASKWTVSGWLRRGGVANGALDVALAPAPCNDLLASLPAELRGPLDGMVMTGEVGGHAHLAIDLAAAVGDGVDLSTELDGGCSVDTEPPGADVTALAGVVEHAYPDGTSARVGRGAPGWIELKRMPGYVPAAFVAAEDAQFWDHHGFDIHQIARSLEIDLRERRLARGGSTISQQLVKNVFLSQRRSADRKLQEAILTWRLEARLDKKAILERYLNVIELGPHVFGLTAAAKHWFGVSPSLLTLKQAAFLAALTSEPTSMSRRVRHAAGLDPDSSQRVDVVLRAMAVDGFIDGETAMAAHGYGLGFVASALRDD